MRVLDLGCGDGQTPQKLGLPLTWQFIGLDAKYASVSEAHVNCPQRPFVCARGERLPFAEASFDRVVSNVALPYMDIAKTLSESYRILAPGGTLFASLHPVSFTFAEFRGTFLNPKAFLYRIWVLANGVAFHITGRNFGEAFQTERGVRIALERANFSDISFRQDAKRWMVEAVKPRESQSSRDTSSKAA